MAKFANKKTKKKSLNGRIVLLIVLSLLLALMIWVATLFGETEIPLLTPSGASEPATETAQPTDAAVQISPEVAESETIVLGDGLQILYISSYAGIYMEDGSDETVSDVMMILLENTSEKDLQLVRIDIAYEDFTAEFEVTSLPAGEKIVALEKNRHSAVTEKYQSVTTKNVVFFAEAMSLQEERLQIEGSNGVLDVTNISGEDITGPIYIYYKNSAKDLLYGGITYRVEIKSGLAAGETQRFITGHYTPENSRIVMVTCGD